MNKTIRLLCLLILAVLAGLMGYAAAIEWLPPARTAAVQVDVDLTQPNPSATEKKHETEPLEVPSPSDIEVQIVKPIRAEGTPLRVLIYHSHTFEAYEPDFSEQYKPTERWRTADPAFNITRIGAELARVLTETYNLSVTHDTTAFELPRLSSAYQRSLVAIEDYTARGETFDVYIDLHRDAYVEGRFKHNTVDVDGKKIARVMFLIGKGTGTFDGEVFAQLPVWGENLSRAEAITEAINDEANGLCRPVSTNGSRYNQHVSTGALLVEIGNNMNSLEEALLAVPYLAKALAETAGGTITPNDVQHLVGDEKAPTTP